MEERPAPRICCLDLDTFFVSVERLLDPSLEGEPVVVGGRPGSRGVVTAASYEVRALGVRSGMSLTEAARLAPDAIYLPTRHGVYGDYSKRVREIAERYSPVVRVASIDELFVDLRGCERMYRRPGDGDDDAVVFGVVEHMLRAVRAEVGLPASAGLASSRALAKIASGLAKPRGALMVRAGHEADLLAPLSVRKYPGIGPVAERRLARLGVFTLGQVASADEATLRRALGAWAPSIRRGALGQSSAELGRERPAFHEHDPDGEVVGSISNERTFREDVRDPAQVEAMLCSLCERVCWRARRRGVTARTVTLKLRYADFHTLSRSRTLSWPTDSELELYPVVRAMYRRARTRRLPVRLLGVALSRLAPPDEQLALFPTPPVGEAVDAIRDRYGYDAVRLASSRRDRGVTVGDRDEPSPGPRAGGTPPVGPRDTARPRPGGSRR